MNEPAAGSAVGRSRPSFGVDLITFFDAAYWGVEERSSISALASSDATWFWTRILDALAKAGIQQLELTFAPADYMTATRAFGSVAGFVDELRNRGLSVVSGYHGGIEGAADLASEEAIEQILDDADRYAQFLAQVGARYLVVGLPMRRNSASGFGYDPVDLHLVTPIADLLNRVGAVTARHGIRTLVHTESHSILWNARDIDLMMILTDALQIGLCLDTGHVTLSGSDPVEVAHRHLDRLSLLHWKDAAGAYPDTPTIDDEIFLRHRPYFRPVGDGVVDWPALVAVLNQAGFQECVLLELDAAPDPEAALITARASLESILGDALPGYALPRP